LGKDKINFFLKKLGSMLLELEVFLRKRSHKLSIFAVAVGKPYLFLFTKFFHLQLY
jgi:hypothetical protein